MWNRALLLIGPGMLLSLAIRSQSFEQAVGGSSAEFGRAVVTDGSAYVIASTVFDQGSNRHLPALIRTNSNGAMVDSILISVPGRTFIHDAVRTTGGGVVLAGSIIPDGKHDHDALLIKVNSNDLVEWIVSADEPDDQHLLAIQTDANGNLYCGGSMAANGHQNGSLIKYGPSGNILWTASEGGPLHDNVCDLVVDAAGIIATGRLTNFGGDADLFLWRTDLDGATQWTTSWGGISEDVGRAIIAQNNGSYVVAGHTTSFGMVDSDSIRKENVWVLAVDAIGDTLWTSVIGDTLVDRRAYGVTGSNGVLYVGGELTGEGTSDALVVKMDQNGNLSWEKTYDLGDRDRIEDIEAIPTGFHATGWSFGPLSYQVLLMRKNSTGD
ncbi:MAG: hypothetical protein KDB88_09465 [Flavobacteriales bacterium]|nr:hypothetical protein [Flavobacteriales bacterium]